MVGVEFIERAGCAFNFDAAHRAHHNFVDADAFDAGRFVFDLANEIGDAVTGGIVDHRAGDEAFGPPRVFHADGRFGADVIPVAEILQGGAETQGAQFLVGREQTEVSRGRADANGRCEIRHADDADIFLAQPGEEVVRLQVEEVGGAEIELANRAAHVFDLGVGGCGRVVPIFDEHARDLAGVVGVVRVDGHRVVEVELESVEHRPLQRQTVFAG